MLDNAAGVEAGQTTLRFRDVNVGIVERLRFTADLKQVVATARIDKDVARFVDASAQFWVVRPSVTAQGVSGIETVLSGVYIDAYWDATRPARASRRFDGPAPPAADPRRPARPPGPACAPPTAAR